MEIFLFRWLGYQLNTLILKGKGGHCDVIYDVIISWLTLTILKEYLEIPGSSNILQNKNRVFLRGNQRFVYKSKIATKKRVCVASLKFYLQSESYRSILAIIHFCDTFYSKIKIIQVSFVPVKWAIKPPKLMDYDSLIYTPKK